MDDDRREVGSGHVGVQWIDRAIESLVTEPHDIAADGDTVTRRA